MKGKCWKCGEMNKEQPDGFCFCPGCNLWYAPVREKLPVQRFLDDEEAGA